MFGSACSGVGCIDLGLERAGLEVAWQIEISEASRQVLRRHWPRVTIHDDLRTAADAALPPVDLLVGGTPCQGLSVAGRGAGLADERSGLFVDFVRLADALTPRCRWVLWENVPGTLSTRRGEDFAVCLEGFTGWRPAVPRHGWRNTGACVGPLRWCVWRVLDGQWWGVAQRRRRLVVVAGPRDRCRPEVLLEPESLPRDSPPSREEGSCASTLTSHGPGGGGYRLDDGELGRLVLDASQGLAGTVANTLMAGMGKSRHTGGLPVVFDEAQVTSRENRSNPRPGDPAPTLNQDGRLMLVPEVADPLTASEGRTYSHEGSNNFRLHNVVTAPRPRRLTPRECERLQGLPDDWTAGQKDSPRYRKVGNGAVVPLFEWIGRRILAAEAAG